MNVSKKMNLRFLKITLILVFTDIPPTQYIYDIYYTMSTNQSKKYFSKLWTLTLHIFDMQGQWFFTVIIYDYCELILANESMSSTNKSDSVLDIIVFN